MGSSRIEVLDASAGIVQRCIRWSYPPVANIPGCIIVRIALTPPFLALSDVSTGLSKENGEDSYQTIAINLKF